ncbi:MAG: DUF4373 domain-containing protein [Bacteroides sp.]|nr:DUF4373 domain-containing protein [Bacteroides sp.]
MARPKKNGLEYFPLDVDFFDDEKIVAISGEYGLKGEIVTLRLLCAIYRNGYFIEWSDMIRYKVLRSIPGMSAQLLDQIVNRLVKWGFFDKALFDSDMILTSRGIQARYFNSVRKRTLDPDLPYLIEAPKTSSKQSSEKGEDIKDSNCSVASVKATGKATSVVSAEETLISGAETPVSSAEMTQSKVNKSKVNKKPPEGGKKNPSPAGSKSIEDSQEVYCATVSCEVDILTRDDAWCRSLADLHHIELAALHGYLNMFRVEEYSATHTSLDDARSHFARWLRKLIAKGITPPRQMPSVGENQRQRAERLRRERLQIDQQTKTDRVSPSEYLRSRGLDPNSNIADLIQSQIAEERATIIARDSTYPTH